MTHTECAGDLKTVDDDIVCASSGDVLGKVVDGIPVFNDAIDKEDFFEIQIAEKLTRAYDGFDRRAFDEAMTRTELWEMDRLNKSVGVAQKRWWEPMAGAIENKRILEVGCGVNYLVPYWLDSGNDVCAFDICKENVFLLRSVLKELGMLSDRISLFAGDAQTVGFNQKFDVVNINNVLHHIEDKTAVFKRMHSCLEDDGKLLIVEPNYFYPPRWAIETDVFDPLNPLKKYFVENNLIERGEKAVIFKDMLKDLEAAGFRIDHYEKDKNYLGYFTIYWMQTPSLLSKSIHFLDRYLFAPLLPRKLAPFEYIVATKA